jgi:hypothetical protein
MAEDSQFKTLRIVRLSNVVPRNRAFERRPDGVKRAFRQNDDLLCALRHELLVSLSLVVFTISFLSAGSVPHKVLLPTEVFDANDATVCRTVSLQSGETASVRYFWLQVHGLRYADQASLQVNAGAWISFNNDSVIISERGRSFGGIGGGFSTLVITVPSILSRHCCSSSAFWNASNPSDASPMT